MDNLFACEITQSTDEALSNSQEIYFEGAKHAMINLPAIMHSNQVSLFEIKFKKAKSLM